MCRLTLLLSMALVACGGTQSGPAPSPPQAPAENDPAFTINEIHDWYLIGNALTPGDDELLVQIFAPDGTETVDMWIGSGEGIRLFAQDGQFVQRIDISTLPAGEHNILFSADGSEIAFATRTIKRSHPLYVVVTTDWDDPDNTELALTLQEELHEQHSELKLTHFVGPYTFTDPTLTTQRRTELADWVKGMRDDYGDEIGLHIHPYCNFVETAGVECLHEPSVVYSAGDETGYSVACFAYAEDDFVKLLNRSDELFVEWGLGKPTSFRAGAWTADSKVLRALGRTGYVADTSAANWARLEEWKGEQNGVLYDWNSTHWASIGDTSQPYYPHDDDASKPGDIPVLEVPDNGILVDYVSSTEMIEIFDKNWDGVSPLTAPVNYSIGYHPSNFNETYKKRMHLAMNHVDRFLAVHRNGPVVYETLSNMALVWPKPE
jgi:hypothetical protein